MALKESSFDPKLALKTLKEEIDSPGMWKDTYNKLVVDGNNLFYTHPMTRNLIINR